MEHIKLMEATTVFVVYISNMVKLA